MVKFMIGQRTSKLKGTKYYAIWLEDETGKTLSILCVDKTKVLEIALLYRLSTEQLEKGYVLGDSISDF